MQEIYRLDRNLCSIFSKHYHDNIVISFYMGYTIDIYEYWRDFKEAGNILDSNIKANYLREEKNRKLARISVVDNKIKEYLNEGVMTEEYVLKNIENLLMIMREGNLILRWFILQRDITNKKFREIINEGLSNKDGMMYGYTETNKLVNFKGTRDLVGKIVTVKITDAKSFSLDGELVE